LRGNASPGSGSGSDSDTDRTQHSRTTRLWGSAISSPTSVQYPPGIFLFCHFSHASRSQHVGIRSSYFRWCTYRTLVRGEREKWSALTNHFSLCRNWSDTSSPHLWGQSQWHRCYLYTFFHIHLARLTTLSRIWNSADQEWVSPPTSSMYFWHLTPSEVPSHFSVILSSWQCMEEEGNFLLWVTWLCLLIFDKRVNTKRVIFYHPPTGRC
jgi:hypothetical protein